MWRYTSRSAARTTRSVPGVGLPARRASALRTFASSSKTWYEEKYERDFQRRKKERVYTGRKDDDSIKVQRVQW